MPYTLQTAPAAVKDALPKHGIQIWVAAYNNASKEYSNEKQAFATAWAAVRNKYRKGSDGTWIAKADLGLAALAEWMERQHHGDDDPVPAPEPVAKETPTKTIGGEQYPARCFLVVPDPGLPSGWSLPVRNPDGTPDHGRMGAALAALTGGYRGNEYAGPDKEQALGKLKALYHAEGMEWPGSAAKSDSPVRFEVVAEVKKIDAETRKVWGWASVIKIDGETVVDKQGDVIDEPELQGAVHEFIKSLRHTKVMHQGDVVGEVVDSFVFTEDVQRAFGIDLGRVGWAVGMEMPADVVARCESGELPMLSLAGSAVREVIVDA